jgi:ATP-dependent DNA helicase RecQ
MLKVLEVEGALERSGGGWLRTLRPWFYDEERVKRVTAARRGEQAAMLGYATTDGCRMRFLRAQLDDESQEACGLCDRCRSWSLDVYLDPRLVADASDFLRNRPIEFEPRKQWLGVGDLRGRIPEQMRNRTGRALASYNDGGWGTAVKEAKYQGVGLPDELVQAAADLVRLWQPEPSPRWIAYVPSYRHPDLVAGFASQLGASLGVPVLDAVRRVKERRPQKEMENSVQQLRNVYGAFEVIGSVLELPCLLVDDIVDSGWTLAVIGAALLAAGSGPVHPLVLAQAVS